MSPTWIVVAVAVAGLSVTIVDLAGSPTYRRLAVRNIVRRRGEALLIVVGAMFGTAVIGAALIVGDSFDGSIRDIARTELGPVDIVVSHTPADGTGARQQALRFEDRIAHSGVDHVDGLLPIVEASAVFDNGRRGPGQRVDPRNCLAEVDFPSARRFGPDPIVGLDDAGATPETGEAVVGRAVADQLGLGEGATLTVHLYGQSLDLVVRDIEPTVGLAGFCGALIAPGTLEHLWQAGPGNAGDSEPTTAKGPSAELLVSLDGAVFDSVEWSVRAERSIRSALGDEYRDVEVIPVKQNRIESAERNGSQLRTIFSGIGGFSVLSGVLLLVNLVIMLAEERKVEFGLLRAVGFRRSRLLRSFGLEGSLYSLAAAVLGAGVSVGVGALVVAGTQRIFADPDSTFRIDLFVHPRTLVAAAALGYAISVVTVWAASARVARLNIISAIRDLPDPRRVRRHTGRFLLAVLGVAGGLAASVHGVSDGAQLLLLAGVPIAAFSTIAATAQLARQRRGVIRAVSVVSAVVAIGWTLGSFTLFPDQTDHAGMSVFVVMGILLVTAAVVVAVAFAPLWGRAAAARGGSFALSCRLGLAYPLARTVRTGLTLAMFSLVVFTMVFMASLASTIDHQASSAADDLDAGYDVVVDSNVSNPMTASELEQRAGVIAATTFVRSGPEFTIRYQQEPTRWAVSGFDEAMLRVRAPVLVSRLPRFDSDEAVFEAVLSDPRYIVVNDQFLLRGGGPKSDGPEPGDGVTIENVSGQRRDLVVAGVLKTDAIFQGSLWSKAEVESFLSPATVENRAFLSVSGDPAAAARRLEAATVTLGTEVSTFEDLVAEELGEITSFMRLLQVYLGFGLVIGIAGLGVTMVRAARERRHEIGTLRAMGLQARVVSRAFLIEAFFIAAGGVVVGTPLALVTAYQVVVNSSAFSLASDSFTIPWLALVVITVAPTLCAVLAAGRPARTAGRIRPAVALRLPD